MTTEASSNGRGRPSTKPITERVFEQWERAAKAKARFEEHAQKLAKLSAKLTDADVKKVEAEIKAYKENGGATVEGKISV